VNSDHKVKKRKAPGQTGAYIRGGGQGVRLLPPMINEILTKPTVSQHFQKSRRFSEIGQEFNNEKQKI